MNKLKTINFSLIIGILMIEALLPVMVMAKGSDVLASFTQKDLTISESYEGKLFHLTKAVKAPNKTVMTVLTSYTSTPDQTDDSPFIAASGKHVYDGMVAANWLPMGTKIKIPSLYGEKIFTVDDRMNSRYGYGRMDIWLDTTRAEARKFGVKRAMVEVYFAEAPIKVAKIDRT